jgi:hypothetical protein
MPSRSCERRRWALVLIAVCLPLLLSSCASRRADASPPTPAPITPTPTVTAPISVTQTQVQLPPPQPVPEAAIPARPPTTAIVGPERPPASPESPAPSAPPTAVEPPAPTPAVPQLGRLLTADQRREYNRVINQNVLAAQASLDSLQQRPLREAQRSAIERVRSFLVQVEEARRSDLELARSLSDRARLLAEDMVRNMPR